MATLTHRFDNENGDAVNMKAVGYPTDDFWTVEIISPLRRDNLTVTPTEALKLRDMLTQLINVSGEHLLAKTNAEGGPQ